MQRLKTRSQFQAVLNGGVVARTLHFSMHRTDLESTAVQSTTALPAAQLWPAKDALCMGAMVPKRLAKRAVTRNAIRRQIYSVGAEFEPTFPVAAHVVRLRTGFDNRQFRSATSDRLKWVVRRELQQLFIAAATPRCPAPQGS